MSAWQPDVDTRASNHRHCSCEPMSAPICSRFGAAVCWAPRRSPRDPAVPVRTTASRSRSLSRCCRLACRRSGVDARDAPLDDELIKRLSDVDVRGKRVFIRADLNVPQDDAGDITDDTRIRASVPGIRDALSRGAAVMVTSHLGRPTEGEWTAADSLAPIGQRLSRAARHRRCRWSATGSTAARGTPRCARRVRAARELPLQQGREEERRRARAKDGGAVRRLRQRRVRHRASRRGDDARHREVRAGRLRRAAAGRRARRAGQARSRTRARPLVAIVAGSKVSTKLTILRALAAKVDELIVGGGIANTFILAAGGRIGKSLAEPDLVAEAKAILDEFPGQGADSRRRGRAPRSSRRPPHRRSRPSRTSQPDDLILDIGPTSVAALKTIIARAGTIVWNGPVGVFEFDAFAGGHAKRIARSDRRVARVLDRRRRRHGGRDRQVRRRRQDRLHLDRRRRVPRVPRREDAAGGRDPRTAGP